jgi:hypothetical protein
MHNKPKVWETCVTQKKFVCANVRSLHNWTKFPIRQMNMYWEGPHDCSVAISHI